MVASALGIDARGAAHLAAADEENLVPQAARLAVLDEGGDGVVEGAAHVVHAGGHGGVVHVGVHVPHEAGGDRDEARAAFAQAAGEEEELAQGGGVVGVVLAVLPRGTEAVARGERRGVVTGDGARVFAG